MIREEMLTPVVTDCDVLVCGGGFAGISAALAAARQGAKVILLEKEYILGGLGTAGLVTIYLPLCDGMGHQVSFGIAEELFRLSVSMGAESGYPDNWLDHNDPAKRTEHDPRFKVRYNPHLFAMLAEKLLREVGVEILYGTYAVAVSKKGDKIDAVVVENKSGRQAIRVKSVVDATGDCDIAHFAHAPTSENPAGNSLAAWYYFLNKNGYNLKMLGFLDVPDSNVTENEKVKNLSSEYIEMLAEVNGKREIQHGNTFYTHFCYSNPKARRFLVDFMVEYIKKKPFVDFVHMWLADAINNQCECEECCKMHPSDWYVMLLNELDEELTKTGSDTRIALIMYVETERPPQKLKLNNPKRFVLLSAIGLHYEEGYKDEVYKGEVPEYKRNEYHPAPNALRLKWHKKWKEICGNIPSVIFEYRFYTDMYCDMGNMQISRETYRDMKALEKVSFNGVMSDQTHRLYIPTALPMLLMGETSFDTSLDYETYVNEYFEGAFGIDGKLCRNYLEELSELFCPSNVRIGSASGVEELGLGDIEVQKKCWKNNSFVAEKLSKIPELVDSFIPVIKKNISSATDNSRLYSWHYLKYHAEICKKLSLILFNGASGNMEEAHNLFYELRDYLSEIEIEIHNVFDLFLFLRSLAFKLNITMPGYFD